MRSKLLLPLIFLTAAFSLSFLSPSFADDGAKTVKAVDVKGNKTVSSLTILAKVKTQAGQTLSSAVLNEDLKRLYGLGFFTDVKIEQEDFQGGVKVIFIVTEKPILSEIKLEGNNKIKKDQIKKEMQSVLGDFVDPKRVRDDVEAVKKLYEKKGFSGATVDSALDVNPDTNQAVLRIIINEGSKVRIRKIIVEGNKSIKAGDFLSKIKTKPMAWWGLFHTGFLKEDELDEDLERIKEYYDEQGFSDAEVTSEKQVIQGGKDDGDINLKIIIKEGKKYLVGAIEIKGNTILKTDEVLKVLEMKTGKPFSRRGLRLDVANIQDLYFDKGYLSCQIRSESVYNEAKDRVDLSYSVTENELVYVDKVKIQGNTKTKDVVIRRELRAYPGESFSGAKLKRSKERLYNLGFFEDIRFDTEPGSLPNTKDLVVSVKEGKTGEFSFGGGYSSVDSIIGFVQVRQKNFDWRNTKNFTGAGQDFGVRLELGSVRKNAELSFTEPWAFGYPYSFGFDLYDKQITSSQSAGYFFDQKRLGGDLRLGKEFTEFDKALLMYRLEQVKISSMPDNASQALLDEVGTNVTSSLALTLTHDERDNIYNPTKGFLLSGTGEMAGGPFGGDRNFMKLNGVASTYLKNFEKNVLELKLRAGIADAYDGQINVPIYERYFAGGGNTIRGYKERRIGPRDPGNQDPIGGEGYWITNVEETFPVYPDLIKGAVFFDAGDVYDTIENFGTGKVFTGIGAGVRVKTPIGPVKLDAGYPLEEVPGEKRTLRFYFNISQGF